MKITGSTHGNFNPRKLRGDTDSPPNTPSSEQQPGVETIFSTRIRVYRRTPNERIIAKPFLVPPSAWRSLYHQLSPFRRLVRGMFEPNGILSWKMKVHSNTSRERVVFKPPFIPKWIARPIFNKTRPIRQWARALTRTVRK